MIMKRTKCQVNQMFLTPLNFSIEKNLCNTSLLIHKSNLMFCSINKLYVILMIWEKTFDNTNNMCNFFLKLSFIIHNRFIRFDFCVWMIQGSLFFIVIIDWIMLMMFEKNKFHNHCVNRKDYLFVIVKLHALINHWIMVMHHKSK